MKRTAFAVSSGVILGLTAMAKLWTVAAGGKILLVAEPLSGLPFKHVFPVVAAVELAIAIVCFVRPPRLAAIWVAWIATCFLVYRIGLWWMGWKKPCGCLGNLTDALHISPQTADIIIKVVLAYLLIGSYGLLIWQWRTGKRLKVEVVEG